MAPVLPPDGWHHTLQSSVWKPVTCKVLSSSIRRHAAEIHMSADTLSHLFALTVTSANTWMQGLDGLRHRLFRIDDAPRNVCDTA